MRYPEMIEYHEAVQSPSQSLSDPDLQSGSAQSNPLGLPLALSGGFALTYTFRVGAKKFAVRCFHKEVPSVEQRYAAISSKLKHLQQYFVDFDFQPRGILVKGKWYPIIKMDWAEGEILGNYLDRITKKKIGIQS